MSELLYKVAGALYCLPVIPLTIGFACGIGYSIGWDSPRAELDLIGLGAATILLLRKTLSVTAQWLDERRFSHFRQ